MTSRTIATQHRRLAVAVVIAAAIVFAPLVADRILKEAGLVSPDAQVSSVGGLDAWAILEGEDAEEVLARLEKAAEPDGLEAVPSAFLDEVGILPEARDVRASGDGAVVGYVVDADVGDVLACVLEHMQARGWTGVSLGGVDGYTFLKGSGRYTWALATCTQVGNATSVVMRLKG